MKVKELIKTFAPQRSDVRVHIRTNDGEVYPLTAVELEALAPSEKMQLPVASFEIQQGIMTVNAIIRDTK